MKRFAVLAQLCVAVFLSSAFSQETILLKTEFQDVLPKFVVQDGVSSGISYEIMKLMEKRSSYRFDYKERLVPLARVVAGLESGYMDVQIGLQKTPEREAKLVYGPELYSVRLVGVVPINSPLIDRVGIDDLIALKSVVLTPFGTGASVILRAIPGLQVDDQARTAEANMDKLLSVRGSILIYHDLSLNYLMARSKYDRLLRFVEIDSSGYAGFDPLGQYLVFSVKVDSSVVADLGELVNTLRRSGELEAITGAYFNKEPSRRVTSPRQKPDF